MTKRSASDRVGSARGGFRWWIHGWVVLSVFWRPAAAEDLRFEHLSVEDGLSHSSVRALHQDAQGFLWVATESYLHRYDGYEFRVFKSVPDDPETLSPGVVLKILEDQQQRLWFGTRLSGLNRYDPAREGFVRYVHDADDPESLTAGFTSALADDREGRLWVGTSEGLNRLDDPQTGRFTRFLHHPDQPASLADDNVNALTVDRAGDLWIATDGGLDRWTGAGFRHYRHDPSAPDSLASNSVVGIFEDSQGVLWAGTGEGTLNRLDDRDRGRFTRFGHDPSDPSSSSPAGIYYFEEDRAGRLWLGSWGAGLSRFDRQTGKFSHFRHDPNDRFSLASDDIQDLYEDRTGILWIATQAGLDKLDPRREQFEVLRHIPGRGDRLIANGVLAVTQDEAGVLWLGSANEGVSAYDRARGTIQHYPSSPRSGIDGRSGLPEGRVEVLLEDSSGVLWAGTSQGLAHLDRSQGRFIAEPALAGIFVLGLLERLPGELWVGTSTGLRRRTGAGDWAWYSHDPDQPGRRSSDIIYSLYEDRSGRLWLATVDGLSRFVEGPGSSGTEASGTGASGTGASGTFVRFDHEPGNPNSPSHEFVTVLLEDDPGVFWVGTYGGGLNRFRPAGDGSDGSDWRSFREEDGLANDKIVGLIEDESGLLWIATQRGLSRFDPQAESFRNYDVDDGLAGNTFYIGSQHRASNREIFFGGTEGLTSFFPDRLVEDPEAPTVVLTELRLADEPVAPAHGSRGPLARSIALNPDLTFGHRDKTFSLSFAALHFASPDKNRYVYRLEGYDEDWIEAAADRRFARYTNLDPGRYVFRVKASNQDGAWNEAGTSVRIRVLPPPWKTWWAYSLYALAVAVAVVGTVRWQRAQLWRERQAADRERALNRRLREVDRLKDEFLAKTSHELRTPLYGMTGLAESLIDGATGDLPESTRDNLGMIVASGRRLGHLVDDILDFSLLRHKSLVLRRGPVDLRPLAEVVLTLSRPLIGARDLELRNAVPADLPAADADEDRLQQILYNLVGNAVKFTDAGKVEVSAAVEDGRLRVQVSDTGVGIPATEQERIFGAFEQADASAEREHGGTGLGLAVTRQLVELHGGQIDLESAPGAGSVFSFDLPMASSESRSARGREPQDAAIEVDRKAELPERSMEPVPESEPPAVVVRSVSTGAPRVLVVDDEPVNLQVVRNYLAVEDFQLTLAASGEEALRRLEQESFDLVLLDIMMPKISGYEVCRILREHHSIADLPVIFLTARSQDSDVVAGMALGANDYLTKPVSKDRLLARMRPHLDLLSVHRNLEDLVESKMSEVKVLEGLLPICADCKRIRDEKGCWQNLEAYIDHHSEAEFSHGICPDCVERYRAGQRP